MLEEHLDKLRKMKEKIESIEQEALDLKTLGDGVPMVEKNVQTILSAIYCLKFGVSDIVDSRKHRKTSGK
jgi:hypothetical protein